MKLLITIDTECDNAWAKQSGVTTENARYLPRFQELCEKYGFKPTYLVSQEMAEDEFFREFAMDSLQSGMCEIGAHPHPWNSTPDYKLTSNDMKIHPYMIEYPEKIMKAKIGELTDYLEDKFGTKMFSHRAGRWAFNEIYANILADLGYQIDCSVTPHIKLSAGKRPATELQAPVVDYTSFPTSAYLLDKDNISKEGNMFLLEIPMTTILHYGCLLRKLYDMLPSLLFRRAFKLIFGRPVSWFRPHSLCREMMHVAKAKLRDNSDYIMFMLHSSEFMPGGSPLFKNQNDIERLYADIDEAFSFLKSNKVEGLTCKEYRGFYFAEKEKTK